MIAELDGIARDFGVFKGINRADGIKRDYYRLENILEVEEKSGSALTDFQIDYEGKCKVNDRYTSREGKSLPFWIEDVKAWIKIDTLPTNAKRRVFRWVNPLASPASNGINTFEFFDDFSNPSTIQLEYVKESTNPVFGSATLVPDNSRILRDPVTAAPVQYDGKYWMVYSYSSGIGIAYSTDLISWTNGNNNPILSPSDPEAESWENAGMAPNSFLYMGNESGISYNYWLFYAACPTTDLEHLQIGIAKTNDMSAFTRDTVHNPIISWVPDWVAGATGVEDFSVQKMSNGYWAAAYEAEGAADETGKGTVGMAETTSSLPDSGWTDKGQVFSSAGSYAFLANPAMIRHDKDGTHYYEMFYECAPTTSSCRICGAWATEDNIFNLDNWTKIGEVFTPAGWESDCAIPNGMIKYNNEVYIYYTGGHGEDRRIGLVTGDYPSDGTLWDKEGTPTISGGILTCNADGERIVSKNTFTYKAYRAKISPSGDGNSMTGFNSGPVLSYPCESFFFRENIDHEVYSQDASNSESYDIDEDTGYAIYDILWKSGEAKFYRDGILKLTASTYVASTALPVLVGSRFAAGVINCDWILVRKYASPEPTVSIVAS